MYATARPSGTDWRSYRVIRTHPERDWYCPGPSGKANIVGTIHCHDLLQPAATGAKTADIINQSLNCELVELNGLRECSFGSHEGSLTHDWLNDWLVGEDENLPQDVEPISDFLARTTNAINLALEHPGPVLIVAHGGTYMAINQSLARDQQWNLPNCQPVRHEPPIESGGHWRLKLL